MRNTETLLGRCVYCGKRAIKDCEYDEYTKYSYQFCDCPSAKKEIEICEQIDELKKQLPKPRYDLKQDIELYFELDKLKRKYPDLNEFIKYEWL